MNQVFRYALNIRLLLRAINECQTQSNFKGSNTGLPVCYLVISVILQLTCFNTFSTCMCPECHATSLPVKRSHVIINN